MTKLYKFRLGKGDLMQDSLPRVCILSTVHNALDIRIFKKEALSLARAGYRVTLVANHHQEETLEGVRIIPLPKTSRRFTRIFVSTWRAWRTAMQSRASLCHFHDAELIPAGLLLRLAGKKVIYDVHEDTPELILTKYWLWKPARAVMARGFNIFEKTAVRFFNAVVTATPAIAAKFTGYAPVRVIQNFPLLHELVPALRQDTAENAAVFVGGISKARGIREMMEALCLLPPRYKATLRLAGVFMPSSLQAEAEKSPGWQKVDFLGWVDRPRMLAALATVKVGLVLFHPHPNHIFAQPNKMFEYMSAGLPVIASHFPLWREIIEGDRCGLTVDPKDPRAIADAMQYLFDNPQKCREFGENGRSAVLLKYNWSMEEKKLLQLYGEVLQGAQEGNK